MAVRPPKPPRAAKTPPPTVETVAVRMAGLFRPGEPPALWKTADLKRRLTAKEQPLLAAALTRLQEQRKILALKQGKIDSYVFAEPLREWLAGGSASPRSEAAPDHSEALFGVYSRLVRQSGGFPDVKIVALQAALDAAQAETLPERLVKLWREGRVTFSQGDWSLADEPARAAAVGLNGERYLLVRLEDESGTGA